MQAQVKDEVQEAQPLDSASQKTVTDWLMHVISGKQQATEERQRTSTQDAVEPDPIFKLDPPVAPKEINGNGASPEVWTGAFTAEDLCGAPAIPLPPRVEKPVSDADAITADDVCWVPEELRLKPQPMIVERPHQEPMASVVDITREITREPAPHFGRETAAPALVPQEREVTAADISRQWVIDEMDQASAAVAPTPEPEPVYVPHIASTPVQEEIEVPEPVAAVAPEPEVAPAPAEPVFAPEPVFVPEPVFAAEPAVVHEPAATFAEHFIESEPEAVPLVASVVDPEMQAADVEIPKPVAQVVAETAVSRAEVVEPAHVVAAQSGLAPEIANDSAVHYLGEEHASTPEPDKYAGVKVWAKGGYWEGSHPATDGTEQPVVPVVEGKIAEAKIADGKVEMGLGAPQQNSNHGYFGSYLGPEEAEEIEKAKPEGWSQSWRTLIRLGSALPWLSRALPALEAGMGPHPGAAAGPGMNQGAPSAVNSEVQQDVAGMRLVQYEIRTTVQDHSSQLKRMEEQLARVRDSVESKAANRELAEDVQSAMKMLKMVGIGLGGLLLILIVLALVMVMKH